jgi:MFS family permease
MKTRNMYPWVLFIMVFSSYLMLPMLSTVTLQLKNSTPFYLGLTLGIFGLTFSITAYFSVQLAHKVGPRVMSTLGLLLFAVGSLLAAWAESVEILTLARAVQGLGAGTSVLLSTNNAAVRIYAVLAAMMFGMLWVWSLTAPQFFLALMVLSLVAMIWVLVGGELTIVEGVEEMPGKGEARQRCLNSFFATAIFAGIFTILPINILLLNNLPELLHPVVYLPAGLVVLTFYLLSRKRALFQNVVIGSRLCILAMAVALWVLSRSASNLGLLIISVTLLLTAFVMLEVNTTRLPVGMIAGKACLEGLGLFVGAVVSALIYAHQGSEGVYLVLLAISLLWSFATYTSRSRGR